jgi:hypothetical protein
MIRSEAEIQRAHDLLTGMLEETEIMKHWESTETVHICQALRDALCWILKHDAGGTFETNLTRLEAATKELGYEFVMSKPH